MATFVANFRIEFDRIAGQIDTVTKGVRTLTDNEANTTFERTGGVDVITGGGQNANAPNTGEAGSLSYEGTFDVTINGVVYTMIVGRSPSPPFQGDYHAYGNLPAYLTEAQVRAAMPQILPPLNTGAFTVCFMAGTLIATPQGERAVETLAIGDLVLAADRRAVPVRWMGHQTRHKAFSTAREFAPVRVAAGALGAGLPHTDLLLTGDHALIVDGLAVNASVLVNGTTIVWEPMDSLPATVTYWHIETEAHEEILANGAAAETFIDYVGRSHFDNHQEYLDMYGCERIIPEMKRPRISARRQLPADLAARFGIGSFGVDVDAEFGAMVGRLTAA